MSRKKKRVKKRNRKVKENNMSVPYGSMATGMACHSGIIKVFTIGKVDVYAGSAAAVRGDFNWDLMLRLHQDDFAIENPDPVKMNDQARLEFPELAVDAYIPPIIEVSWRDFGEPDVPDEWWKLLNDTLLKMGQASVVMHCYGGHGRTGTALAILAGLNKLHETVKGADPVSFVRANYCYDAVESITQIRYVEKITGCKVTSVPAFSSYDSWWERRYKTSTATNANNTTTTTTPTVLTKEVKHIGDGDMADVHASAVRYHYVGGDVYAEDAEGNLVNVGKDDGSYYGPAHKAVM